MGLPLGRSVGVGHCWGPPAAPPAVAIGTAKPMPTKKSCLAGLASAGDDADHLPGPVEQRAAAVAGVDGGVELDEPGQRGAAPGRDAAVGGRHDARGEAVRRGRAGCRRRRPRRRPAAAPPSPRARRPRAAGPARARRCRSPACCQRSCAAGRGAVGERELDLGGAVDDVQRGEHRARRVDDDAAAEPGVDVARRPAGSARCAVTVTSDGVIVWSAVVASGGVLRCCSCACCEAALHGLVDVGRGERRRPVGPEPARTPSASSATTATATDQQHTPPAPTGPVPLRCLRLPNRRRGLDRSHFSHTTPRTGKSR